MKLEKEVILIDAYNSYGSSTLDFEKTFIEEEFSILKSMEYKKAKLTLEVEEPILDDAERKYLSDVIRPFRNEIEHIRKIRNDYYKEEYILIYFKDGLNMTFPYFKKGTMYKKMKLNKEYTLKDLNL